MFGERLKAKGASASPQHNVGEPRFLTPYRLGNRRLIYTGCLIARSVAMSASSRIYPSVMFSEMDYVRCAISILKEPIYFLC